MKIIPAKTAGFCMGVRRAVEVALDAPLRYTPPIFTFGPLIHNPQVLDLLEEKDIRVMDEVPAQGHGTVIIRAHGVPPEKKEQLTQAGYHVIDATCPRVIKVQRIIEKHAARGYATIIIGDEEHPEVIGLRGYAGGKGYVAGSFRELDALETFEKAVIVAQTTQNIRFYEEIKRWVQQRHPHYRVFDTICDSTEKRQDEVRRLAKEVDVFVVVGGFESGNTRRLAGIAKESGKPAFHVETESDLNPVLFANARRVGLTAGASTPNWIIKRVYRALETMPRSLVKSSVFNILRFLMLTNIYAAVGAGCLCFAASKLQRITDSLTAVYVAVLYILAMHTMNHLTGSKSDDYNDPDRALYYKKYRFPLAVLAVIAGMLCFVVSFFHGLLPFLVILVMSFMGFSYNIRLVPKPFTLGRYFRIRDIPGSKTIAIAMAWGIVTAIYPILAVDAHYRGATAIAFLWATTMAFVRTAFSDIIDMQGDRIVGKETIPILMGEKKTMKMLKIVLAGAGGLLFAAAAFDRVTGLGFLLMICPALMLVVLFAHERGFLMPGIRLEFLIDTHFILAGVLTYLWLIF
ncbi:MAG: 4-hydroxy-3-methylbut-2-enyl diphosphate reductase [Desulfobacterales bacterium]